MKYRSIKTEVDGHTFDSKKEAARYSELKLRARNGQVRELELQPAYRLEVNGVLICKYIPDFRYLERVDGSDGNIRWSRVVEDVKGIKTPVYRLKRKLMLAIHNVAIRET